MGFSVSIKSYKRFEIVHMMAAFDLRNISVDPTPPSEFQPSFRHLGDHLNLCACKCAASSNYDQNSRCTMIDLHRLLYVATLMREHPYAFGQNARKQNISSFCLQGRVQ